ncbi:MAG: xanthine dehydrogenase family protein molybdopterin-binding subunit [Burkholderiaceae bacterium]|nr:xanthine dehydrogenase family protein molybdopterin-binding subunit [Burkholderiaceae bacterium]
MGRLASIARRTFLVGSAAVGAGVVFGYWKYRQPLPNPLLEDLPEGQASLTPYVRIDDKGVTIIAPRAEMGQGVHTTLAALVAEELSLPWDAVRVEHGPASSTYYNAAVLEEGAPFAPTDEGWVAEHVREFMQVPARFLGMQITGGSSSIVDAYEKMRVAGAAARYALLEAAAARLGAPVASLRVADGAVHAPDGKRLRYPELASDATRVSLPAEPELKPRSDWQLLGKSLPRVDMHAKCTGRARFGIDVRPKGVLFASLRMNPHLGAAMKSFDASEAERMPGVRKVVPLAGGVVVVATNTWYAFRAAAAIRIEWAPAAYLASSEDMMAKVVSSFDEAHRDSRKRNDGDVDAAFSKGDGRVIEAQYEVPYLAHATMEPMNATAWLRDGRLDVWAGNQAPTQARADAARIADIDQSRVRIHTTMMGGGFGRRAEMDFVKYAVHVAKAMPGTPVQLTWSREEDTAHDFYRPMAVARLRATVGEGGPAALDLSVACQSVMSSQMGRIGMAMPGPDLTIVQGAWDQPYRIPNYRVTGYRVPEMLPVSSWRSVGNSQNGFFHECSIDEIAHATGRDPLKMRLDLIDHVPSRKVIEAVAEMSDWGGELPPGHARGMAFVLSFGVPTAEVIEVAVVDGRIRLVKAHAAADVGVALDPRNLEAQVQSGMVFGLTAAIQGAITVKGGRVEQSNFHDYGLMRLAQCPPIAVRILENGSRIRGIGEPGTPPAAPALANAIFAATGKRIRALPLSRHVDFA